MPRLVTTFTSEPEELLKSAVWPAVFTLNSSTLSGGVGKTPDGPRRPDAAILSSHASGGIADHDTLLACKRSSLPSMSLVLLRHRARNRFDR